MTTFITLTGFGGLLLVPLVVWAIALWLGARWAGIGGLTLKRAFLLAPLVLVLKLALALPLVWVFPSTIATLGPAILIQVAIEIGVPCGALVLLFRARWPQALLAWLPTLAAPVVGVLFALVVFRPFFWEAFTTPTNSMAPTILGQHWQGVCPRCGEPAFGSVPPQMRLGGTLAQVPPEGLVMNCSGELRYCRVLKPETETLLGDRFLVNKMLHPQRWDIIIFRIPGASETLHVKRLVGLPGEKIVIRDSAIWADGERLEPPESLQGIEYFADPAGTPLPQDMRMWGHESRPALLGEGEYFVLGDFPARSKDSRLYEGTPGHPPYAVPESFIEGVVTHIHWPPSRWRTFR